MPRTLSVTRPQAFFHKLLPSVIKTREMWHPLSSTKTLSPPVTKSVFALSFPCRVTFDCQTVRIPIELMAVGPAKNISSSCSEEGGVAVAAEIDAGATSSERASASKHGSVADIKA